MPEDPQTTPSERPILAFFDVDNTLMRGTSLFQLGREAWNKKVITMRDIAPFVWHQMRFIRKGENISALEVENHLYAHPKVADVAVIGLPDAASGERVCAVVVSTDHTEPLTFDDMIEHLRTEGLMTQKLPEQLELVTELPRNPTGKVLKHELRVRFGNP